MEDFKRDPVDAMIRFGSLPQRAHAPWFPSTQMINEALTLPDVVCGPGVHRSEEYASLIASSEQFALLDGISPHFHSNDAGFYHVHCFPAGTLVGLHRPRAIEDLVAGDMTQGHDGRTHRVLAVTTRPATQMLSINAVGPLPVCCTPDHPVLALPALRSRSGKKYPRTHRYARRYYAEAQPVWMKASDLLPGDFLLTPRMKLDGSARPPMPERPQLIPECERGGVLVRAHVRHGRRIAPSFAPTRDRAWLTGVLVGDGHVTPGNGGVGITMAAGDDVERAMSTLREMGLRPVRRDYGTYVRVRAVSIELAEMLAESCGTGAHNKRLPEWAFSGEWDVQALLDGLLDADGWRTPEADAHTTVSPVLAAQVYALAAALGHAPVQMAARTGPSGYKPGSRYIRTRWQHQRRFAAGFHWRGFLACPVRTVEERAYDGPVYNIEVEDTHSYVAGGVAVHNCDLALNTRGKGDAAGIAMGRIAGSWEESGNDGLGMRFERILRQFEVPLVAQIVAPMGEQIQIGAITRFILQLKQMRGFNITSFSFDGFQCLAGDTLISTSGGLIPIAAIGSGLAVGEKQTIEIGVQSLDHRAIARTVYRRGPSPTLVLMTRPGYRIEATHEHRLWVRGAQRWPGSPYPQPQWKVLSDIRVGDQLAIKRSANLCDVPLAIGGLVDARFGSRARANRLPGRLDEPFAEVIGLVMAEGCVSRDPKGRAVFSVGNTDRALLDRACEHLQVTFGGDWKCSWSETTRRGGRMLPYAYGSVSATGAPAELMLALGASGLSHDKIVPWAIERSPAAVQAAFLRGLFEGDGGVAGEKVVLNTSSHELARGTQRLLLEVGVFSRVWRGRVDRGFGSREREISRVVIQGPDLRDYLARVGFLSPRKTNSLRDLIARLPTDTGKRQKHRRDGDLWWCDVSSIETSTADCYDLSVPGPESFVANGVVSHNSSDAQQQLALAGLVTAGMRVERDGSITGIPKPFSVDRNDMAYRELREAMNERRVALPRYELLRREMRQLESTSPGKAPDHAVGGTKDSSDATAGVVGYLSAFGHAVLSDPINGRVFGRKELGLEPVDDFLLVEDEMDWGFDPMGTSTGGTLRLGVE